MWQCLEILREQYLRLGIMDAIDYEKFCMISIVYNSSKIEGCSLTELDTRILIENGITAQGKPLSDHLMVKDHYHAFLMIKEASVLKRKLSTPFFREINAHAMKSTGGKISTVSGDFDTSQGDLRLAQVYIEKKYFPDFSKVPGLLQQLADHLNNPIDEVKGHEIIKLAADIHYNFINIHPFGDGNGRTARLLMNYIQLYHGEPMIKIFIEDRAAYIQALNEAEEKENPEIFREFICLQQIKFLKLELEKFRKTSSGFVMLF
jgi:Fic family protein